MLGAGRGVKNSLVTIDVKLELFVRPVPCVQWFATDGGRSCWKPTKTSAGTHTTVWEVAPCIFRGSLFCMCAVIQWFSKIIF